MKRVRSKTEPGLTLWLIERQDVGIAHVVRGGNPGDGILNELTLTRDHVGQCYVVDRKHGDYLIYTDVVVREDVSTD